MPILRRTSVTIARIIPLWLLLSLPLALAQTTKNPDARIRRAMEVSIRKQLVSVRGQMHGQATKPDYRRLRRDMQASVEKQHTSVRAQPRPEGAAAAAFFIPGRIPAGYSSRAASNAACRPIAPSQIGGYLDRVAKREGLTAELLRLVIGRESAFRPCAISPKGALGLMQLMPATAAELGVRDPFDPKQNIDGGARYLNYLLRRFGDDVTLALAAYNAGPARVDRYRGVPPVSETHNYVTSIIQGLKQTSVKKLEDPKPATE